MSTATVNTFGINSYSLNPESIPADRYMGLPIVFVPSARAYRVTDVNGISYFAETKKDLRSIMSRHGRRVLKTKAAYVPRRVALTVMADLMRDYR